MCRSLWSISFASRPCWSSSMTWSCIPGGSGTVEGLVPPKRNTLSSTTRHTWRRLFVGGLPTGFTSFHSLCTATEEFFIKDMLSSILHNTCERESSTWFNFKEFQFTDSTVPLYTQYSYHVMGWTIIVQPITYTR